MKRTLYYIRSKDFFVDFDDNSDGYPIMRPFITPWFTDSIVTAKEKLANYQAMKLLTTEFDVCSVEI